MYRKVSSLATITYVGVGVVLTVLSICFDGLRLFFEVVRPECLRASNWDSLLWGRFFQLPQEWFYWLRDDCALRSLKPNRPESFEVMEVPDDRRREGGCLLSLLSLVLVEAKEVCFPLTARFWRDHCTGNFRMRDGHFYGPFPVDIISLVQGSVYVNSGLPALQVPCSGDLEVASVGYKHRIENDICRCNLQFDIVLLLSVCIDEQLDDFLSPCVAVSLGQRAPYIRVFTFYGHVQMFIIPSEFCPGPRCGSPCPDGSFHQLV